MTYEQYWYGDPLLVRDYLKAEEYRRKRENYALWMQGLYIRDAIMSSIGNAFLEKGHPPNEYPILPYPIDDDDKARQDEAQEKRDVSMAEAFMKNLVTTHNARWEQQHGKPPA